MQHGNIRYVELGREGGGEDQRIFVQLYTTYYEVENFPRDSLVSGFSFRKGQCVKCKYGVAKV